MIFQTYIIWFNRIHSLKYLRSATFGSKDIVIRKSEFVAKTQFLSSKLDFSYPRFLPPACSIPYSTISPVFSPFSLPTSSLFPLFSPPSPSVLPPFFLRSPVVPLPPSLLHTIHGLNLIIHLLHFSLHQYSIGGIGLDLSILGSSIHMGWDLSEGFTFLYNQQGYYHRWGIVLWTNKIFEKKRRFSWKKISFSKIDHPEKWKNERFLNERFKIVRTNFWNKVF